MLFGIADIICYRILTQPSFYYQVFYICIANSFVNFYTYRLNPLLQSFTYLWQLVHNRSCGIKGNLITSNFITRFRSYQDVTFLKFIHASIFFCLQAAFLIVYVRLVSVMVYYRYFLKIQTLHNFSLSSSVKLFF